MGVFGKVIFYAKSTVAVLLVSTCAVYGMVASLVLSVVGKRHLAQWTTARAFYFLGGCLGISIKLINSERLGQLPAVIVSNHQSELDVLLLGRAFPPGCTVTAKESLRWVPILGWFMALSGTVFLDRSNRSKSVQSLNSSLERLKRNKQAAWIFPEGTRSYSTELQLLPFKKGAFHLAQQAKIPVIPVVMCNTSTVFNPRLGIFNRGKITAKVLEPIDTSNMTKDDVDKLVQDVHAKMQAEYEALGYASATVDTSLPEEALQQQEFVDCEEDITEVTRLLK
ncbi:AaceriAFR592Wp [[Ashbya] aceris (nom. inval.)]|nr:AaceriAFR592Wp [[Ashbya] aceris (nom. inval.)]